MEKCLDVQGCSGYFLRLKVASSCDQKHFFCMMQKLLGRKKVHVPGIPFLVKMLNEAQPDSCRSSPRDRHKSACRFAMVPCQIRSSSKSGRRRRWICPSSVSASSFDGQNRSESTRWQGGRTAVPKAEGKKVVTLQKRTWSPYLGMKHLIYI